MPSIRVKLRLIPRKPQQKATYKRRRPHRALGHARTYGHAALVVGRPLRLTVRHMTKLLIVLSRAARRSSRTLRQL